MCAKGIDKYVTRHREDLTGEHSLGDAGQLVLFILFLAVWITDAFIFKYSTLLNDYIPFYAVRLWMGIVILVVAGYMAWTGMKIVFGNVRDHPMLSGKASSASSGTRYTSARYCFTWVCSC